jgi:hypothetical protein
MRRDCRWRQPIRNRRARGIAIWPPGAVRWPIPSPALTILSNRTGQLGDFSDNLAMMIFDFRGQRRRNVPRRLFRGNQIVPNVVAGAVVGLIVHPAGRGEPAERADVEPRSGTAPRARAHAGDGRRNGAAGAVSRRRLPSPCSVRSNRCGSVALFARNGFFRAEHDPPDSSARRGQSGAVSDGVNAPAVYYQRRPSLPAPCVGIV